jgi:hypothetical protein
LHLRLALFVLGEHRDARVDGSHQFGLLAADPVRQPRQSRVELQPEPDPLFKKNGGLYRRAAEVADRLLPVRAAFAARRQEGHDEPAVAFAEPDVQWGPQWVCRKPIVAPTIPHDGSPFHALVIRVWPSGARRFAIQRSTMS